MVVEVSCFCINVGNEYLNFTFVKYEKFVKIVLQQRKIIISIERLVNNPMLFELYLTSLLCTKDLNEVPGDQTYWILAQNYSNANSSFSRDYLVTHLRKDYFNNPLLSQEPKRETSLKKQNKFFKLFLNYFNNGHFRDPLFYIDDYITTMIERSGIEKIFEYERKIEILSCIRGANRDVYSSVLKWL
jgi:hypothetical protein